MNTERDLKLAELLRNISIVGREEDIPKHAQTLYEEIYDDEQFRHSYASISATFYELMGEDNGLRRGDPIMIIAMTMDEILLYCNDNSPYKESSDFLKKLGKLVDHVHLEYQRMNDAIVASQKVSALKNSTDELQKSLQAFQTEKTEIQERSDALDVAQKMLRKKLLLLKTIYFHK